MLHTSTRDFAFDEAQCMSLILACFICRDGKVSANVRMMLGSRTAGSSGEQHSHMESPEGIEQSQHAALI